MCLWHLTPAVSRAKSRSEARAEAVGVGSSAWLGAAWARHNALGVAPRLPALLTWACAPAWGRGSVCPTRRQHDQRVLVPRCHGHRVPHAQARGPRHGAGWAAHPTRTTVAWATS